MVGGWVLRNFFFSFLLDYHSGAISHGYPNHFYPWVPMGGKFKPLDWSSKFNNVHLGLQGRRAMPYSINVSPLTFQSGGIAVSQCMSLATLCLAPLIAHIIAGAPEPTYFSRRRPKWHERMCIYSPLSTLWRYAAMTDGRIRALD